MYVLCSTYFATNAECYAAECLHGGLKPLQERKSQIVVEKFRTVVLTPYAPLRLSVILSLKTLLSQLISILRFITTTTSISSSMVLNTSQKSAV